MTKIFILFKGEDGQVDSYQLVRHGTHSDPLMASQQLSNTADEVLIQDCSMDTLEQFMGAE